MSITQLDKEFIWHPFTQHGLQNNIIPITKAKGVYLNDEKGNAYIDAISSWWTNIHGHGREEIAKAIYNQAQLLDHVLFAGCTHEPATTLANNLLQGLPNNQAKVFFSDNGSTAIEVAIKMAVQYQQLIGQEGRNKIFAFTNSYHGDTFGSMSVSSRSLFTLPFQNLLFQVHFLPTPTANNINEILLEIEKNGDECIAFIYEPLVQGAGGMCMYEANPLNKILAAFNKLGAVTIADEVMTGFGRTGTLFASNQIQTKPDIICLSKGITGGTLPLAVTSCTQLIFDAFYSSDLHKTFFHGHSYTANPIACAAANASWRLLQQPDTTDNIKQISQAQQAFVQKHLGNKKFYNLRSCGTILAFELHSTNASYTNKIKEETMEKGLSQGIFIRPLGNTVYCMPPYCITTSELAKIHQFFEEIELE
jgi:adenosylmethionine---8-amino-7-oxononanoate aminotransferase